MTEHMRKLIFRGAAVLLCLLLLAACSESEETISETPVERTSDLTGYKLVVNATVGAASRMLPETGAWENGDKIYIILDGEESNAYQLTYSASGKQFSIEPVGQSSAGFAANGTVTGLYASAGSLSLAGGKLQGTTKGDVVYTPSGSYTKSGQTITITMRLDQRKTSLVKITGCSSEAYVENMKASFTKLTSLKDLAWDETDTTPSYIYDAAGKATYCYGALPDDGKIAMRYKDGYRYTLKSALPPLAAGEMKVIQGPEEAPDDWVKDASEFYADGEVITYHTATGAKAFTLVVIPEGYQLAGMKRSGGQFYADAKAAMDKLFTVEPYNRMKDDFNVYFIAAASKDAGADIYTDDTSSKKVATERDTYFGAGWGPGDNSYSYMGVKDENKVYNFVKQYCPDLNGKGSFTGSITNTAILMLINDTRYAGMCHSKSNGQSYAMVPTFPRTRAWSNNVGAPKNTGTWTSIVVHEFGGHGIGRLGDEYYTLGTSIGIWDKLSLGREHLYSVPFSLNVTSSEDNYGWDWMKDKGYSGEGLYEGAYGYEKGVWRPESLSCMADNRPYFNAWSRYLIMERVYKACGLAFDKDVFYNADSRISSYANAAGAKAYRMPSSEMKNIEVMPMTARPVVDR
ncbi:IgA Peptidase M64 [Prevotella sp. KH2C16]|nr:IgA Peptidase M64 [Prevotella sp. KH2C16]